MTRHIALSRRQMVLGSCALGCSLAANPLVTPVTFASTPGDSRLVVIILRGGMDGLDVVRPLGDKNFAKYRQSLSNEQSELGATDLDGFFAMHAALGDLMPLWQSGELAFAHAVSTPYRDKRSHFDGQDLLEAGGAVAGPGATSDGGWLNRMLALIPGARSETAFAVGRDDMIVLNGSQPVSSWSPDARIALSAQGRLLLQHIYHDDPIFAEAGQMALDFAADDGSEVPSAVDIDMDEMSPKELKDRARETRAAGRSAALAKFAAERLNEETRIAAFSINGWDTHRGQQRGLNRPLGELTEAILSLRDTLGSNWGKTTVLAMTEFGRTVRENGSGGTDHGTGGAMVMAGGALHGGRVFGQWPGLGRSDLYRDRDLMPTADVRSYAAAAISALFGLPLSDISTHIFPHLDTGNLPRIIA